MGVVATFHKKVGIEAPEAPVAVDKPPPPYEAEAEEETDE